MLIRNKSNILVVRASYKKAYPIVESLRKAGYSVVVGIDSSRVELRFSLFPNKLAPIVNPYVSERLYVTSVLSSVKKYGVDIIIPVGFIDFLLLSKYKDVLEKYAVVPVEDYEKVRALSDKWYVKSLAESVGVNYPKTIFLKGSIEKSSVMAFMDNVGFPLVIKGLGDNSTPRFVSDFDTLLGELNVRVKDGVLLQEFIPGVGAGYFALSYEGEPIVEFMHKRILEASPLGGASVKASFNFDPCLLSLGRRTVRRVGWTGIIMVEFKKHSETGDYYLMEVNPKFWGSLELAYRAVSYTHLTLPTN